jgi:hypothetical protein
MLMLTQPVANSAVGFSQIEAARQASPLLWRASLAFLAAFAICLIMQTVDPRLLNGISVWVKPAKFFFSLAIHMATLAWGLSLLPREAQVSGAWRRMAVLFVAIASLENLYIVFRAARGEASHFNVSSRAADILYSLMGLGAVTMMLITAYAGWHILRKGHRRDLSFATGTGFLLASLLTVLVAGFLGNQQSHWIGGDRTDATGLPFLGWSTTGGDLRVSHFVALHLMQALPLAAFVGGRILAIAAAILGTMLTGALFFQAVMGMPFLTL